jgi:hypothetical protein
MRAPDRRQQESRIAVADVAPRPEAFRLLRRVGVFVPADGVAILRLFGERRAYVEFELYYFNERLGLF